MGKIFCSKCGSENEEGAVFCSRCGKNLGIVKQSATIGVQPTYNQSDGLQATPNQNMAQLQYNPVMKMNYPKASLGSRLLASIADTAFSVLALLPGYIFIGIRSTQVLGSTLLIIGSCWVLYYSFFKDGLSGGQSYGKRMNGLMVVNITTNRPCTKVGSAIRALGLCIPYVGGIIEAILVLVTDKGHRLGDMFAGTQVIELSQYKR